MAQNDLVNCGERSWGTRPQKNNEFSFRSLPGILEDRSVELVLAASQQAPL